MTINPTQILRDREQFHVTSAGALDEYFTSVYGVQATELINEVLWLATQGLGVEAASIIVSRRHNVETAVLEALVGSAYGSAAQSAEPAAKEADAE